MIFVSFVQLTIRKGFNMTKYTGSKCLVCDKEFTDEDDIVVCPECGTPYHRDCYLQEGKCINSELHEKGESWEESKQSDNNAQGIPGNRCPRCGSENSNDKLFCEKCGMPLIQQEGSTPFNENFGQGMPTGENSQPFGENAGAPYGVNQLVFDQNSVIDGVKLGDYAKYIGVNPLPMLTKFIRFGKFGGKISMNIFSFIFPHVYFFFRKMKGWGVVFLLAFAVLAIPSMVVMLSTGYAGMKFDFGFDINGSIFKMILTASSQLSLLVRVLAGMFANYIYYKKAKKDIMEVRKYVGDDDASAAAEIEQKGGTSWAGVIISFTLYTVIVLGGVFALTFIK